MVGTKSVPKGSSTRLIQGKSQNRPLADFALLDARGGDPVSLAAYLSGTSQDEAAQSLTTMLGIGK